MNNYQNPFCNGGFAQPSITPAIKKIMIFTVVVYFIQRLSGPSFTAFFGLVPDLLLKGYIWQLLTYNFLHDPYGIGHIIFNMMTLYFCGSGVERVLGFKKFIWFYILCGVGGGIVTSLISIALGTGGIVTIGASAAVLGVLIAFAQLNPQATFLIFFIIPVKAKHMTTLLVVLNLLMGLPDPSGSGGGIAVWAHLGGMAVGYLLIMWDKKTGFAHDNYPFIEKFTSLKRQLTEKKLRSEFKNASLEKDKVDVLLDKIAKYGMPSLSDEERTFLTNFSRRQSKK